MIMITITINDKDNDKRYDNDNDITITIIIMIVIIVIEYFRRITLQYKSRVTNEVLLTRKLVAWYKMTNFGVSLILRLPTAKRLWQLGSGYNITLELLHGMVPFTECRQNISWFRCNLQFRVPLSLRMNRNLRLWYRLGTLLKFRTITPVTFIREFPPTPVNIVAKLS